MPDQTEFNESQASDLARYFLGPGWTALRVGMGSALISPSGARYQAATWRLTFRAAGVKLPSRRRIVNVGTSVMDGESTLATARSSTQAQRIAVALNFYAVHNPDTP